MYDNTHMDSLRIDKWLWAARFFKTRALASKACDMGRILSNGHEAKPSREVHVGDHLVVKKEGGDFQIEVLALSQMRGPASVAQTLYRESEASKEARAKLAAERKAMQQFAPLPTRRPSKRDRRRIISFRGRA
jgi:ribosome-associated heat shock protein Hsp15